MKYGFIGCGNMGSALVRALSKMTDDIIICDRNSEKAEALSKECSVKSGTVEQVLNNSERLFLAIKPQGLDNFADENYDIIVKNKPLIISMLAGVTTDTVISKLGSDRVIRIMPNTPVGVGKGVVLYSLSEKVGEDIASDFLNDMKYAGTLAELDEDLIDAGCAVSGCGPAYMYMMIDAVSKGAEKCGLDKAESIRLAALTMIGSAEMVLKGEKTPDELKTDVCSPGGSTIEGVKVLEKGDFYNNVSQAIISAYNRNRELGKK